MDMIVAVPEVHGEASSTFFGRGEEEAEARR